MKIGIIGAGYTGLTAGLRLAKEGHDVVIFEADEKVGGLAGGFKEKGWEWPLDYHYHHWFTGDKPIKDLAKEIGNKIFFLRPKTSTLYKGKIFQLDSPLSLLKFPHISFFDRLRTGLVVVYLRINPRWKPLEKVTSKKYLIGSMGKKSWEVLWRPLFVSKFGKYADKISASWFWARIRTRTPSLGYPTGGFQVFAEDIQKLMQKHNGKIFCNTKVEKISRINNKIVINTSKKQYKFDKVICTLPASSFLKITKGLQESYIKKLKPLLGIGAVTLILSLKHKFFEDETYWLNVNDKGHPFLALVEHTNFVDKKHYNNEHLLYIGNYLETTHKLFNLSKEELLKVYEKYLKKISPKFNKSWVINSYLFRSTFAQPVFPLNYSKQIPDIKTSIDGLYLANMQQIYPWDRGTTFAVELGEKVANLVIKST
jgi:protoporphyrinogen oxidase